VVSKIDADLNGEAVGLFSTVAAASIGVCRVPVPNRGDRGGSAVSGDLVHLVQLYPTWRSRGSTHEVNHLRHVGVSRRPERDRPVRVVSAGASGRCLSLSRP
jgi:hypothetical protein